MVYIGIFALHDIKGINFTVVLRLLPDSIEPAAMMAGTEQPKPIIIGIKALPDRPKRRNILSKMKAIRAM